MIPSMRHVLTVIALTCVRLEAQEAQDPTPPPAPAPAARVDFEKQIVPILVGRCIKCHGAEEQKGDLRLDSKQALFPADQELWTVQPGKPDDSELVRRIGLPVGDEDIMPNKGEPLTKAQQELIRRWVGEGADWPATGDAHIEKELAALVLPKIVFELPSLDADQQAKIDAAVAELRKRGAVVQQVAQDTKALDVNLSLLRDKVGDAEIALLPALAPALVWLNVSRTAVSDAGARHLAALTQLRRLNAANTKLSDAGFAELAPLSHLEYLNAYGTGLSDDGLQRLVALPKLERLYVWQSKVTADGAKAARLRAAKIQIDLGDYAEERMAAAQKEIAERDARNRPVNDVCPVTQKPVDAAQTVEHEGKRIGFCCAKCKAAFTKDPAKYADKIVIRKEDPK